MSYYLGIEIGGTKLQFGIGPGDGTLAAFKRLPVDIAAGADGIQRQILESVPLLLKSAGLKRSDVAGLAFGFGGPVDDMTRRVITSHQVSGWDDFPLADWTEDKLTIPTILGNDCDVAGLAESLFGAGKGLSPVFYMTVGSGIGGALIINGEIYRGCGRGAAEIGHSLIEQQADLDENRPDGGWPDVIGVELEKRASGWSIANQAQRFLSVNRLVQSHLRGLVDNHLDQIRTEHVAKAASAGDRVAKDILNLALTQLAFALCQVIALLCPRRIIIGGGVSLMGEKLLFEPLRKLVAECVFKPFADCYDIVPAALGEEVVVHGALALARKKLGTT